MKNKNILCILFLVFMVAFSQRLSAQNSFGDIKVDDLSDSQVRQLMQKIQSAGYTDDQAWQLAQAQGMPSAELQKLKTRIGKIKQENAGNSADYNNTDRQNLADTVGRQPISSNSKLPDSASQNSLSANNGLSDNGSGKVLEAMNDLTPKIFGASLFHNSSLTFEPNMRLATPKNYVIGPDDELLLDITGDNEASYKLKVSPDGTIRVQYAGIIAVGGLTIEKATSKISATLAKTYPGIRSGRTSVSINVGNIRSIKVTLVGEVVRPGSYTLSSLSTVFNALYSSGGPNKNGSFRKIQVIRNNKVISTVDIYNFLLKGIQSTNIRLEDQDIINVPVYQTRVLIVGEVKRPAYFEMLTGESVSSLIDFAGGFSSEAYSASIKVLQNTSRERKVADVNADNFASFKPANGDKFIVETILSRFANRVQIKGAVFRPGTFELDNGLTLKGLIKKADGLKEDAFLNRGYIFRLNADNTSSLLSFDVDKLLKGMEADIILQREDQVTISSIFDLRDEYSVEVRGEVRRPGKFKYAENLSVESVIQMAGGFKEGATSKRIEISRRLKGVENSAHAFETAQIITVDIDQHLRVSDASFKLQPFDIISVRSTETYQAQKNVTLAGEVLYPGIYSIGRKNERISDVINRAGGFTNFAFLDGASLKRPGPPKLRAATVLDSIKKQEERASLLNLRRLQRQNGVADSTTLQADSTTLRSYSVGINLKKIIENPGSSIDLILQDGDIISVPVQLQTVRVSGEVLKPVSIVYQPGKSMMDYINESGGFGYSADKNKAYVEYANGSVKATSHFLFFHGRPQIKPGAEIFVPKRPPREKLGIQGILGISTALASLAAIFVVILRK
jgi:protein involved in polysaccharide export with SLBB domain